MKTPAALADLLFPNQTRRKVLAWLLMHPACIQPVIGTSHPERIRACKEAENVPLSRGDWYQLYVTMRGRELP